MMKKRICLCAMAIVAVAANSSVAEEIPEPIAGATEYRNVKYLPPWRYASDMAPHRDYQMVMDILVPDDGNERHPVLFIVHGGGWSAGSKDQKIYRDIARYFVQRGYVCVPFNYILRPRGIFPQVFWDYADAARYLRIHAAKYKADPTRFGAIGLSAGGWLISSAGHASGDLLCLNHQHGRHVADLWQRGWHGGGRHYEDTFARPMTAPTPAYPGVYGRFQAISYDFAFRTHQGSGNSPACNQWAGAGYELPPEVQTVVASRVFDFSLTEMTQFSARKVHVPPLFSAIQKDGSNKAEAIAIDGKGRVDAIERIHQFFQFQFFDSPRTPMPEIQPSWRIFKDEGEVRFVMPIEGAEIRYQILPLVKQQGKQWFQLHPPVTEGAWRDWTRYGGPFKIDADCLIRAVATSNGRRDSSVAEAHFFSGVTVPSVTAPDTDQLPSAETGKHYIVQFKSDTKDARWLIAGDLVPFSPRNQAHFNYPNNMVVNYRTGQWSGVPTKPGTYWIQVWVNDRPGGLARHRNYTWTVAGKDLSDEPEAVAELSDPHVELLYLPGTKVWPAPHIGNLLNEHGIPSVIQTEKRGVLFLVRDDDHAKAKRLVATYLESIKYKEPIQWQ